MPKLCGKGIWLAHTYDLQRATEMATSVDATYLIIKIGHGPIFFPETAKRLGPRVRNLGLHALAWVHITDRAPQDAVKAIAEGLSLGYEAVILFLGSSLVTKTQIAPLAETLDNVGIPTDRLYIATPPLPYIPDNSILEVLAPLCQGGWMPLCFEGWGGSPTQVIDKDVYQALGDLSLLWGATPNVYPVLSPLRSMPNTAFLPEEFIPWIEAITHHGVDFFSIYHIAATEKALWPLVESIQLSCMKKLEAENLGTLEDASNPDTIAPQPVYINVSTSDTVWGLIIRHSLTKTQFWEWNGHLWDSRGLPRDPDYMQEGWRIRVK